jgi:hypothetical protein
MISLETYLLARGSRRPFRGNVRAFFSAASAKCIFDLVMCNVGWDAEQFPISLYLTTQVTLTVLKMGGFTTGGLNFAKGRTRKLRAG